MTDLEEILRIDCDWANERIQELHLETRYADMCAIQVEFYEWLDPTVDEHDVFSFRTIRLS